MYVWGNDLNIALLNICFKSIFLASFPSLGFLDRTLHQDQHLTDLHLTKWLIQIIDFFGWSIPQISFGFLRTIRQPSTNPSWSGKQARTPMRGGTTQKEVLKLLAKIYLYLWKKHKDHINSTVISAATKSDPNTRRTCSVLCFGFVSASFSAGSLWLLDYRNLSMFTGLLSVEQWIKLPLNCQHEVHKERCGFICKQVEKEFKINGELGCKTVRLILRFRFLGYSSQIWPAGLLDWIKWGVPQGSSLRPLLFFIYLFLSVTGGLGSNMQEKVIHLNTLWPDKTHRETKRS